MREKESDFVTIAQAHNEVEAIKLKMLLDRTGIPYFVWGDQVHSTLGEFYAIAAFGPRKFVVPARFKEQVEDLIQEMFEVREEVPANCPACESPTLRGSFECPECGLYLG